MFTLKIAVIHKPPLVSLSRAKILWKEAATNQVTGAIEGGSQILKALNAQPLSHKFFIITAEVVKNFNAITEEPQVSFLD